MECSRDSQEVQSTLATSFNSMVAEHNQSYQPREYQVEELLALRCCATITRQNLLSLKQFKRKYVRKHGLNELYGWTSKVTTVESMRMALRSCFDFSGRYSKYSEAVLVSIDVEGTKMEEGGIREIGMSTLDLRELSQILASKSPLPVWKRIQNWIWSPFWFKPFEDSHIRSYNYRVRDRHKNQQPFMFGSSCSIQADQLMGIVESFCTTGAPPGANNEARTVVLVGQSFYSDQKLLKSNGIYPFTELEVLDTYELARDILRSKDDFIQSPSFSYKDIFWNICDLALSLLKKTKPTESGYPKDFRLKHLLQYYHIPGAFFHCGGNDANFTLKLLLMLAIESSSDIKTPAFYRSLMPTLKSIARSPIPWLEWKNRITRAQEKEQEAEMRRESRLNKDDMDIFHKGEDEDTVWGILGEPES